MSLSSPSLSSPSITSGRRASASPTVVTNILNNMYAHHPSSRVNEGPSRNLYGGGSGGQSHYRLRRISSQEEQKQVVDKTPRYSDQQKTSAGGGSRSASRKYIASRGQPSSPNRSNVEQQRCLSPYDSRSSDSTSSSSSSSQTQRVVGRGGSGSKYRAVAPKPSSLDINQLSLDDPAVTCEAQSPPPGVTNFHRPTGRGGVGPLRRLSVDTKPSVLSRLPLKMSISAKFRKDSASGQSDQTDESIQERSAPPLLSPSQLRHHKSTTYSMFNESESDSIQLSTVIPECESEAEEFLDGYPPPPSPSPSTIFKDSYEYATPANGQKKGNFAKLAKMLGELPPFENYEKASRQHQLMQSIPARSASPDHKAGVKLFKRSSISAGLYSMFSAVRHPGSTGSQLSVSTTGDGLHPSVLADNASDSWGRSSATGGTDDYDSRSNLSRCDSPDSPIIFSAPSPDLLPSTHAHRSKTPDLARITMDSIYRSGSPTQQPFPSLRIDTSTLDLSASFSAECPSSSSASPTTPVPAINRSKSYSHGPRRASFRESRSGSISLEVDALGTNASVGVINHDHGRQHDDNRASKPFSALIDIQKRESHGLPELAYWLKSPNTTSDAYYRSDMTTAYRDDSPAATVQTWSGHWNTDIQDVIRALRLLR